MTRFTRHLMLACALWLASGMAVAAGDLGPRFDSKDVVGDEAARTGAAVPLTRAALNVQAGTGRLLDQIVAVVNDEVVTQVDLDERTDQLLQSLSKQGGQPPERSVLRRQVLERMITDRVLAQYGRENGVRVGDATLDRAIARIADENKLSLAQFRENLQNDGVTWPRFREEIRNEILVARLREREIESRMNVTDGEVDSQLREEAARGNSEDELLISHVLVAVPEQADPEQISRREARAREALAKLQAGEKFSTVAASYSDAPDALQGGSLGWRTLSRIPTVFANTAPGMKKGEISAVIRSGSGFHVFSVLDRRGAEGALIVRQYHLRELLVRIDANTSEPEARVKVRALKARLDGGEDFYQVAKLNSEDENRIKGGDIGWVGAGETFPEFERVAKTLEPGKVSEIVQTPMGLHLVQLVESRDNDVAEERRRNAARQGVRQRKVDEAFEDWVRQQRDAAYVEFRGGERPL